MSIVTKIDSLEQKISDLRAQQEILIQKRRDEISKIMSQFSLEDISDEVLFGAFDFLQRNISEKSKLVEDWQKAGEKFCKKARRSNQKSDPQKATKH
ncbi:MAG: hypothetical protein KA477_00100 [Candidatus Levybacteria bacterium]|jgi:hypothetical protein|nr:hypothetical protein [Candidatus Levybacteria bacterium]